MSASDARTIAVLGPTNTGKTHLAIERMLGYRTGMIGFPLRLLARENYDRVVRLKGPAAVALVTGEEKIVPKAPRYWISTVESMPVDRPVEFLAVDEIQMCADPERGHIFTDRLLHARGTLETLFLGADTVRPLLRRLVPELEITGRPRFSTLRYTGSRKLTRLPPRSAVVAFSAADVYGIAELIRRKRGGTAVVLGALSPRTRNAQVALYQAGEVDYMVATDAIGMGLNMDIGHVAFSALVKFDGHAPRRLSPAELAQIAGRAGRYQRDGTFGVTAGVRGLEPEAVEAIENHRFDPLRFLYWRNRRLDFSDPAALVRSLEARPPSPLLRRAREADDVRALHSLARDPEISRLADSPAAVALLWEVCRIPDYRKIVSDAHARLLARIFRELRAAGGLPEDWVARQVTAIDRVDGDIDALAQRIAFVRTWTYISHRAEWLADPAHWQERTRAIEDRLSDALHERLTQRFVDRRTATLVRRMRSGGPALTGAVTASGEVLVEGEHVGRLAGFRFLPDAAADRDDAKALTGAAMRALRREMPARVRRLVEAPPAELALDAEGRVLWREAPIAVLAPGKAPLSPEVRALASDLLDPALREAVRRHAAAWLADHLATRLAALFALDGAAPAGPARGLVFQLAEGLGSVPRRQVESLIAGLGRPGRRALAAGGVRIGRESVYLPALLRPRAVALRALLWTVHHGLGDLVAAPPAGRQTLAVDPVVPREFYEAIGFRALGPVAMRVDRLEALAETVHRLARQGPFEVPPALAKRFGCPARFLPAVLDGLGFRPVDGAGGRSYERVRRRNGGPGRRARRRAADGDSPFAKLREIVGTP